MKIILKYFKGKGKEKVIVVDENETIEEAKLKSGYGINAVWNYEGAILMSDKTFKYYEIDEGDTIVIVDKVVGGGGFGFETIDVSKNQTKNIGFSNAGPYYQYVIPGLSIISECKGKKIECEAKNKRIYIKIGYIRNWDLHNNLNKVICPACKQRVIPLNFGFWDCNYEIEYEKIENDDYKEGKIHGESGQNEFKIFDEYSGKAIFSKLIFNVFEN